MSELKEGFPNDPDNNNNEASPENAIVEPGAEEAKEEKEKEFIHGDYQLRIKIPKEKKKEEK